MRPLRRLAQLTAHMAPLPAVETPSPARGGVLPCVGWIVPATAPREMPAAALGAMVDGEGEAGHEQLLLGFDAGSLLFGGVAVFAAAGAGLSKQCRGDFAWAGHES